MPTELKITAYRFNELDGRAKEKAHAKLVEWITDHEWWQHVYEDAKAEGLAKGFEIGDIRFEGFWSQGDGAHWTGHVNMPEFVRLNLDERSANYASDVILIELWDNGWIDRWLGIINNSYRYCHSGGMKISEYLNNEFELDEGDDNEHNVLNKGVLQGASVYQLLNSFPYSAEARVTEWCDEALEQARKFADEIYVKLEAEYNELTSEESLNDFADANEYLFDERGNIL